MNTEILSKNNTSLQTTMASADEMHNGTITPSGDVAGIELRMLPPLIRDNHTIACWPFPGKAKLYCLTMVVSDVANQLVGLMDLNGFPRVGDNESLPINKTIYYWQQDETNNADRAPNQLHVMCAIIKSKEALRETGDILESVKQDEDYKTLMENLSSIIADTASYSSIANLTLQAAHIVGRYLGKVADQPVGTMVNSFTRLHGDWDKLGINPITVGTKDVDFHFELIIRDQNRIASPGNAVQTLPTGSEPNSADLVGMVPM